MIDSPSVAAKLRAFKGWTMCFILVARTRGWVTKPLVTDCARMRLRSRTIEMQYYERETIASDSVVTHWVFMCVFSAEN